MQRALAAIALAVIGFSLVRPAASETAAAREVKIFVDADKSFVDKAGGAVRATAAIAELAAQVDAIYRSQLGITLSVSGVHLWTESDPFDHSSQSALLASFAQYSERNYRATAIYDTAHLLVGSGLGGEGGIAYPAAACGDVFSAPFAYSLSQPDLTDEYQFSAHLFAHELGHNLNAEHDAFPACARKTFMCLAQIGGTFSADTIAAVTRYVQERSASGCFPLVAREDPSAGVKVAVSYNGSTVKYKVTGSEKCTSLALVASPTAAGLKVPFAYLQLGKLTPSGAALAQSNSVVRLLSTKRIFVGAYCDGQLTKSVVPLKPTKIKSTRGTTSVILALRSLQKGFKQTSK